MGTAGGDEMRPLPTPAWNREWQTHTQAPNALVLWGHGRDNGHKRQPEGPAPVEIVRMEGESAFKAARRMLDILTGCYGD
jgi:hypothetical protein